MTPASVIGLLMHWLLSSQPDFRIQFGGFFPQLEMEHAVARTVVSHFPENLARTYLLPFPYGSRRQVAVNRDVTAVAYQHVDVTAE